MWRLSFHVWAVALFLMGVAPPAHGQARPGPLVTDRPDQTESPAVVVPGLAQFEAGWTFSREREGGVEVRSHAVPQVLARIGIVPRAELRLGFAGWTRSAERGGGGGPAAVTSGIGDLDVGFKYGFTEGGGAAPAIALIGMLTLPTGADGIGSDRANPTVRLAFASTLSERVSLGYNVGATASSLPAPQGGTDTLVDALYTVSFGFAVAERVGAFAESFGTFALSDAGASRHALDGGVTFQAADNLQFDVSAGVGLNSAADDWFIGAGIAVRVPR